MKNIAIKFLGISCFGISSVVQAADKPNIIIILADDMGYSDLGCYGGEIETPNLNGLAQNGLRYKQFYNCARSCPTRASLLTGLYPHQAGMGWMAAASLETPAYQGYLNNQCVTIGEVLQTAGYKTYMSGKWHVSSDRQNRGMVKEKWPCQRGFDRFYGIVDGASNYFKVTYNNDNEQYESPEDGSFYFTHAVSDSATAFIHSHDYRKQPLFLYLAYTAPHWPLHALQKDIDKYVKRYKAGWDELRKERFARQQKMGLFGKNAVLSPRDEAVMAWDKLSPEKQDEFALRMAIYAAQIDAMDQGIGRVVGELKAKGQLDNTIIMFLSDNGACAEFISGGKRKAVDGKEDTFESYRIHWANLSSTPYREYKHFTNEGGIATPLIVHYPAGINKKMNNTFVSEYGHLVDLMATCVDLGKASYPKVYKGNQITPMQGVSLVPNFSGKQTARGLTFWEHEANIAVRDGKWKIVCKTKERTSFDRASVCLYDMEADPTELNDLSKTYPERTASMFAAWNDWAGKIGVYPLDTRDYGERQRANKRKINGEFDDNFGDWNLATKPDANVKFSIDTQQTISGEKTAKIEVLQQGEKPASAHMKWVFNGKKGETVNLSFQAKANRETSLFFRMEKVNDPALKSLDEEIKLHSSVNTYTFNDIQIENDGNYQVVFYVGNMQGTCWIDDVKLSISPAMFTNPIARGADPWVIKTDSCYYYCASSTSGGKRGVVVSKTKELQDKGENVLVWEAPEEGWNRSCVWAPELHYVRGKWYIYYAAGESGPPFTYQKTGVLESVSQDPQGAYVDKGMVYTGDDISRKNDPATNRWAIDMTVFEWNGKLYSVWSGWDKVADTDKTEQNLYIAEMENPWTISMNRILLSKPDQSWETGGPLDLNEGPEALVNKNDLFIIYSCGQSWLPTYKLAQLRLKSVDADPLNPQNWIKSGPVFTGNAQVYGVGHASFTTSPDATENWIVYHSKIERDNPGWKRDVRLQRFTFRADGSPDFGEAQPVTVKQPVPSGSF